MKTKSDKSLMLSTISFITLAIVLLFSISLAWFSIGDSTKTDSLGINIVGNVNMTAKLYYFVDEHKDGALNEQLVLEGNNTTNPTGAQGKFLLVTGLLPIGDTDPGSRYAPGDSITFALVLTNEETTAIRTMRILFSGISSNDGSGNPIAIQENRVENAYEYSFRKATYGNETNTFDDNTDIVGVTDHFNQVPPRPFTLASNVLTEPSGDKKSIIIFFDLLFDPNIYGYEDDGIGGLVSTGNSNIFQHQVLLINYLNIIEWNYGKESY